ncbi:MAG TPA: WD40 repeat domain-containing protein [Planctomycetaceae bacterium]
MHRGRVEHVVFSPDGNLAASTSTILIELRPARGELRIWKTDSGEAVGAIDLEIGAFSRPVFAHDGKALLFPQIKRVPGADENYAASVELYRIPEWKHLQTLAISGRVMSAALHPNGKALMLAGVMRAQSGIQGPGKIWLADLGDGEVEELDTSDFAVFNHVQYAGPEDRFLFGTTTDIELGRDGRSVLPRQAKVVMRSDRTGREIWTSTSEDDRKDVQAIAVSPDGELVAWCTYGTILILDAQRGRLLHGIGVFE